MWRMTTQDSFSGDHYYTILFRILVLEGIDENIKYISKSTTQKLREMDLTGLYKCNFES